MRLMIFSLLLSLLVGCSNNTGTLTQGTAVDTSTATPPPTPPTKVVVVGDANSPSLANYLIGKGMNVLDVPYSRFAASNDLKMAGDYIVWSDNRNGDPDIYGYRISTNTEFVVAKAPGKQWLPSIAGDYIVWEDYRNGNADIYGYQISTATVFPVVTAPQSQLFPQTDGVNVVWQDLRNGNADIYRFQLSGAGGVESPVEIAAGDQWYPQVSGDHIVWQSYVNGYNDVYLYQISSATKTNLTNSPTSSQYLPQLNGDYAVWLDNSNGVDDDLYGYRISTGTPLNVAVKPGEQRNPSISGNRVVWQDNRNGNFDIYAYDFSSSIETRLTSNSADQTLPQISGDQVAWQDLRNGNYNIYASSFTAPGEQQVTRDTTDQTYPQTAGGRIAWRDQRRGVTDVMWSADMGTTIALATNTWLTPAGVIGDLSQYDVVVLANDFVSSAVILNLYDAAIAAGVGVVGLGGTGGSLAHALAGAQRYGISVTTASGCGPAQITPVAALTSATIPDPLFIGINVSSLVNLELTNAVTGDELKITTDPSATDSPKSWIVQAYYSGSTCFAGQPSPSALVEFTDGKSKTVIDGAASMADGYLYWSNDGWNLFYNMVAYVKP